MHDIMPPVGADAQVIHSYGPAGFRIAQAEYAASVLVTPTETFAWSGELTMEALAPILQQALLAEVLIIGTGKRHTMLSPAVRTQLKAAGFGVDSMDTGAACRTYNILLGEGRRVAAVLMLPEV